MPRVLLPSSAKAFAPRAQPYIVLKREYCHWLANVLKKARPGYDFTYREFSTEQATLLSMLLACDTAVWTICEVDLIQTFYQVSQEKRMPQAILAEARYIQAYIVHIDTISRGEMSLKLTFSTIESLINLYEKYVSCHTSSSISDAPQNVTTFHKQDPEQAFIQKVNEFVIGTDLSALESLESNGTGALIGNQATAAREAIDRLFLSVMAPQQKSSLSPTRNIRVDCSNSHFSASPGA